ncbi:MAG: sodium:solute symporter, partial [Acidobacteria bacterium]|nr:sodium:solute symporter [Acidobacteriota bacterium]
MDVSTTAVLVYVVLQLAIGAWISRRIRTEEDYLVAGRRLGYTLSIFTIFATWFGAETCIGAAGVVYAAGLAGGTSDPFGYAVCLFVMGVAFSVPLWRARLTTVADLPRRRYSIAVERVTVLLMVPTSVFWAAAQVRAFGQVLSASSGLAVWVTITVAALVVVIYTVSGGLLADAWTDLLQGIVLIAGLLLLLGAALLRHGVEPFGAIDPARLRPLGGGQEPLLAVIEAWAIPVCGSVFAAELVARMIAARSPRVARRSTLVASGTYLLIGLIPVALGLFAAVTLPGLEHPEQVLPRLAHELLPAALYPVFAGALVSAILSTVDSSLLAAS